MKIVKDSKKYKISHFFEESSYKESSFFKSYFQNKMGIGFVDSSLNPKSVQICVGDFSFYGGKANIALVKNIKTHTKHRGIVVIDPTDEWRVLFEKEYGLKNLYPHYRQSFVNKNVIFDITKLTYYVNSLDKAFYIKEIDENLYNLVLKERWSQDFCINFDTYKDFKKNGIGYLVLTKDLDDNEIIVAGASSYIYYDDGIEIQITTNKDYKRQGLATCIGAKLILSCIDRGINPTWDSANKASSKLAKKFGFIPDKFYKSLIIKL